MMIKQRLLKHALVCVLLILRLPPLLLYSQEHQANQSKYKFEHLTSENGLSCNSVFSILQDREGFIWIGTEDGLNRFDGYTSKIYKTEPGNPYSLNHGSVLSLVEDQSGVLWVGTNGGGINKLDKKTNRFVHYNHNPHDPSTLTSSHVNVLLSDSSGFLWAGTPQGLNRLDPGKNTFTHYKNKPGDSTSLGHDSVLSICEDSKNILWIGTRKGLNKYDRQEEKFYQYIDFPYNATGKDTVTPSIQAIWEDKSGVLWLGTNVGLYQFDRQQEQLVRPGLLDDINSICEDRSGVLWLGSGDGLYQLEQNRKSYIHYRYNPEDPVSLSHNDINCIYQCSQGLLWIGTWGGGVNILDKERIKFKLIHHDPFNLNSLSDRQVFSIYQDLAGILWIATWDGGLTKLDRGKNKFTHYKAIPGNANSLSSNNLYSVIGSKSGLLWIGTWGGGLNKFDPETETFTHYKHDPEQPDSISGDQILVVFIDRKGYPWIGTWQDGLNKFDPETETFTHYKHDPEQPASLSDHQVVTLYEDRSGTLWIGTHKGGLNRFDSSTESFSVYKHDPHNLNSLSNNCIKSIHEDQYGVLWIGTLGGGLNRFDHQENKWTAYTTKDGLPNDVVYGILEDKRGNLWLSSSKGLSQFNPQTKTFRNYGRRDGLQSHEFNTGAYFQNSETGEMFFGGIDGLNSFFPAQAKINSYIPPLVITGFKKFNLPVELDTEISQTNVIQLYQKDNFFSFEFAALNYKRPWSNKYAYKLEGFDKDWVYSGTNRYASYTNLSGGTYIFRVKGSNNDGIWNEQGTSIKVIILPPFWQTTWFMLLALTIILIILFLLHRLGLKRTKIQGLRLKAMVADQTRDLQEKQRQLEEARNIAEKQRQLAEEANRVKSEFLARMSHEMRTPLNAILGFNDMLLDTGLTTQQLDYVNTAIKSGELLMGLINDILDFAKIETGLLSVEAIDFDPKVIIVNVCELIRPRITHKPVEIIYRISEHVPLKVKGDPERYQQVLINLMGNAAKFTEKGEIIISLDVEKEKKDSIILHTAVKDTGIGIPKDKLANIFKSFLQRDQSGIYKSEGAGLGLVISKQIAMLMGGDIRVESQLGKGSTFHFTAQMELPQQRVKVPPPIPPAPHKRKPIPIDENSQNHREILNRQSTQILLVEDNPINQKLAKFLLTNAGYQVETVDNGEDAVKEYTSAPDKFALIFMDIRMPKMDGLEATRIIREKGYTWVPIVALTAQAMPGDREKCLDAGMNDYIPKPIKRESLLAAIQKWASP